MTELSKTLRPPESGHGLAGIEAKRFIKIGEGLVWLVHL